MEKKTRSPSRIPDIIVPVTVLLISLILLLYIGYGEAYRTYPNLQFETLAAVGEMAQNRINTFLRTGFPLNQFPGFLHLTDPLIESEVSISEIRAVDKNNRIVFFNGTRSQLTPTTIMAAKPFETGLQEERAKYHVYADETFYIVSLPLRNKFEEVGSLQIVTEKSIIKERINASFKPGIYVIVGLLILYGAFILLTQERWKEKGRLWLTLSYSTVFLAMAAFVMFTLIGIFSSGVQGKIKALSRSLSERIDATLSIGLDISMFSGLEDAFSEYQELNPEISFIALTEDNIIRIHTNSEFIGKQWEPPDSDFQFSQKLYSLSGEKNIHIGIPRSIINKKLWRYAKNFLILLIASGFLSALFLSLKKKEEELKKEIAERKQAEEMLERSNRELEDFAYVISHDLQTPLRAITSYLQILESDYKGQLDETASNYFTRVVNASVRMSRMIQDLLAYSRVGAQEEELVLVDCESLYDSVMVDLDESIKENGAIITHDALPQVMGTVTQLTQLFQNLIGNSIKYRGEEPPRIHVSVKEEKGEWLFSVRDNGIGMKPEYFGQIFVIFQRLHGMGEYSGTGIGLSICKKIVEHYGGRIWVESQPEEGSIFYFTLPIKQVRELKS